MSEFFDQYKHPKWQKRRLDRLNLAGWKCEACGNSEGTLHVHHHRYVKGRKPWEYSDTELQVLCDSCHSLRHELQKYMVAWGAKLSNDELWRVVGYMCGLAKLRQHYPDIAHARAQVKIGFGDAIIGANCHTDAMEWLLEVADPGDSVSVDELDWLIEGDVPRPRKSAA